MYVGLVHCGCVTLRRNYSDLILEHAMFTLYVIRLSEEDVVVKEPHGVGGGITSAILFLAFWKW